MVAALGFGFLQVDFSVGAGSAMTRNVAVEATDFAVNISPKLVVNQSMDALDLEFLDHTSIIRPSLFLRY